MRRISGDGFSNGSIATNQPAEEKNCSDQYSLPSKINGIHLSYTKMSSVPDEANNEHTLNIVRSLAPESKVKKNDEDLHFSETWFHGRLRRTAADNLVFTHATSFGGDGTFLVRGSGNFLGDYTLSFYKSGKVYHCTIHSQFGLGQQVKFYLVDSLTFDSLCSLVNHYRSNPIRGLEFHVLLTEPVPKQQGQRVQLTQAVSDASVRSHLDEEVVTITCYPDTNFINSERSNIKVRALHDYQAGRDDELSFVAGQVVGSVVKEHKSWWRGVLAAGGSGWFPYNYVEEFEDSQKEEEKTPLGALQKDSIENHGNCSMCK